jgi:hypothetical protein
MSVLNDLMPTWDASRVERRVIDAPITSVFVASVTTDFLDAARTNAAVKALFAIRSATERLASAIRRRPFQEPPEPAALRLGNLPSHGDWVRLGAQPPLEIAFGVIGRFWAGETRWLEIDSGAFGAFALPGFARIGCHLLLTPLADGRTLLTYEARTSATDDASRRAFLRYWSFVSPFVGVVMRSTLAVIGRNAIAATRRPAAAGAQRTA